ncbi:hypothetical protein ACS386_11485 [Flavobacteriaceae bacterium LMO-SS05]
MKTTILNIVITLITSISFSQSYNGNVYYEKSGWDGITANCNVSVIGSTTQNGVYFESLLVGLDIKSLTIAQKVIQGNQIPSNVKNGIKNDARVELDFDVYVNNVLIDRYGQPSVSWARLQGLPNSDGYKPAVKEAGYALYQSGAIDVRNVRVRNLSYRVDQTYYEQIRKDIAGAHNSASSNSSNPSNSDSGSTEVLINGQSTTSNSATSSQPLDNYDPNTGLYSNPLATYNSSGASEFQKNYETGQQIGTAIVGIVSLFSPSPEEQARREREENLRIEREEKAASARAEKARIITSRKAITTKYPDGKTPLSNEAKNLSEVYFFVYSYNEADTEKTYPSIYISNVFALPKYADGTWPFKTSVMDKISKKNPGLNFSLSGYYKSKAEADQQLKYFLSHVDSASLKIHNIAYEIKKASGTSDSETDFWGNSNKKTETKSTTNNTSSKTDFWGKPIKSETNKTTNSEQKQDSAKTKTKVDFWGKSIKD